MDSQRPADESYVEYRVFPLCEDEISEEALDTFRSEILLHIGPLLINYIWQKDPFVLKCVTTDGAAHPPHLHGVTRFGDNIEDEWFIVHLISLVTKKFPGSVASIQDDDGEMLLIEAAHHLPKWVDPDTSTNRVFMYDGDLHIIPYPCTPGELPVLPVGIPSVSHSVSAIQRCPHLTRASEGVRNAIHSRIEGFSTNPNANFHQAVCSVPLKLAAILKEDPQMLGAAVEAFYERDPIDLKACRVMKHFPPEHMVTMQVKMSRIMYAQLLHQRFQPDRRSRWKMPATSNPKHRAADLGMKLAHGFEILVSRVSEQTVDEDGSHSNTRPSGVRWERFLSALKEKGFFQGELEGSKKYQGLYRSAEKYFLESGLLGSSSDRRDSPGERVMRLLTTLTFDLKSFQDAGEQLPDSTDDSWLRITPDQLDEMLEAASGEKSGTKGHRPESGQTHTSENSDFNPEVITDTFEHFVQKVSGYQGVEFPKVPPAHTNQKQRQEDAPPPVNFDPHKFTDAIDSILRSDESSDEGSSGSLSDHFFDEDLERRPGEEEDEDGIEDLMEEMDRQLSMTEVGKSFEKRKAGQQESYEDASSNEKKRMDQTNKGDKDDYEPVDIDVNLLKNILESYTSQQGLAGPASNILHSMGVMVPPNADQ